MVIVLKSLLLYLVIKVLTYEVKKTGQYFLLRFIFVLIFVMIKLISLVLNVGLQVRNEVGLKLIL